MLRVCRIKYFECYVILIIDSNGRELESMLFGFIEEMIEKLKFFVKIDVVEISYIDICMLVLFL